MLSQLGRGFCAFVFSWALTSLSFAAVGPHQVVEQVTQEMMAVVRGGDQALKANPDRYYEKVGKVLDTVVSLSSSPKTSWPHLGTSQPPASAASLPLPFAPVWSKPSLRAWVITRI